MCEGVAQVTLKDCKNKRIIACVCLCVYVCSMVYLVQD